MATINIENQKIHYSLAGKINRPAEKVVFVHGLGGDSQALVPLRKVLTKHLPDYHFIHYDLRGHGRSTKKFSKKASFIQQHVTDLHQLLTHLKVSQPIFISHCFGGSVVQEYINSKLTPLPKKSVFISLAGSLPGLSPLRHLSDILINLLPTPTAQKIRTPKDHLHFSGSHDLNLFRIYSDTQSVGGIIRWALMFGATLGWKNTHLQSINNSKSLFIFGTKDMLITPTRHQNELDQLTKPTIKYVEYNHGSPIIGREDIADIISPFLKNQNK